MHVMHHGAGTVHLCLKPFRCIMVVTYFLPFPFPAPYPVLLEPWLLVLPLRRQKELAFITSSTILDHGTRIHVSSLLELSKTQSHSRIGILLLNLFVFLLYVNSHLSKSQPTHHDPPYRLITSSTNGYDGMSFRI